MTFIILDRDGVINYDSSEYIKSPAEWLPIPGSLPAIAKLNRAGFRVIIATNQSGIARGFYDIAMLNAIHEKLINELKVCGGHIEEIFFCPHHPQDHCHCRKPNPGLLYQIQAKYSVELAKTFFIGDSLVDVQAARAAGCQPLLVRTGKGLEVLQKHSELLIPNFADLAEAVDYVLYGVKNGN
ncbi:MAG: D-glycero-beta-D-manno-heptose-1,7-bisphosphate 7-phosphatase [Gammaproteobacteria bacterium RIFCSPHIGHO2_12_FULL_37_14]|nr:MAG: D-glycero-beta-D-manno-heptose-1,7-bisphosphate 7-phosphatase [Gammaproteobacteria bacterium RIFCSPHIGHO2_12_FULL_37_14]